MCNEKKDKIMTTVVLTVGILSLVFGTLASKLVDESEHNFMMLAGMFSGLGAALIAMVLISYIKDKVTSPEKKKQAEIEKNDERNIQLLRCAYSIVASASVIIFAAAAFVFIGMGYKVPGFVMVGCIYVEGVVFLISYKILSKRM